MWAAQCTGRMNTVGGRSHAGGDLRQVLMDAGQSLSRRNCRGMARTQRQGPGQGPHTPCPRRHSISLSLRLAGSRGHASLGFQPHFYVTCFMFSTVCQP